MLKLVFKLYIQHKQLSPKLFRQLEEHVTKVIKFHVILFSSSYDSKFCACQIFQICVQLLCVKYKIT